MVDTVPAEGLRVVGKGRIVANDDGAGARQFHEATKHSVQSLQREPHWLDWENMPLPFKVYVDLPAQALPPARGRSGVSTLAAIQRRTKQRAGDTPDRVALSRLLHYSLGIIRRRQLADGRWHYFRAAPCTGALYHVDAYLVTAELADLAAGVYHFSPHDFSLRPLRRGDHRGILGDASGNERHVTAAPVVIVLASTYWRNAWKYRRRAYRHAYWDGGTVIAQLLAQAAADGWPAAVVVGFADRPIERLCGLDPAREGAIALVAIGAGHPTQAVADPSLAEISPATQPLSARIVDYPEIPEVHSRGALQDEREAAEWRSRARSAAHPATTGEPAAASMGEVQRSSGSGGENGSLEDVIARRGSTRRFARAPIAQDVLERLLCAASAPLEADYRADPARALVDLYLVVNAVDGLEAGAYCWRAEQRALDSLWRGERRYEAGMLALGQELGADAAVDVYAIADLDAVLGALGTRGYRAATLDGGISGGRAYLAAYAQRLGATGLTFFDDDVARFFGLDPKRYGVTFLTAIGKPNRREIRIDDDT
jgi:SagB-type dehydrogenase family enzyme